MPVEAMFVADVVEEHARVLQEAERRMKKEELLDDSSSGPFDAAKFAAHGPQVRLLLSMSAVLSLFLGSLDVCLWVQRANTGASCLSKYLV